MCGFIMSTAPGVHGSPGWQRALDRIASRGPDGSGDTQLQGVTFGHRRLSILGLGPEGAQPMQTDPDQVLVFNGEIYNFKSLAAEMGISAESDTQVLYEIGRRGEWDQWIHRLRGMWAFVHYDRVNGALTASRDPFGIKPLYVREHPDGELSMGSTVAALVELPFGGLTPNKVAIAGFLAGGLFSQGTSVFTEVSKFEPGVLRVWRRAEHGWIASARPIDYDGWPSYSTQGALRDSVAAHLVSDVEVGVLLSGGVDSTLLAAIARDFLPRLRTFSLVNPESPDLDEGAIARHNARLLGSVHIEVPVTPSQLSERALSVIRSTGEPFSDAACLPLSSLSEVVSQHVKVALAGEGADELFGGYRRYDIERLIDSPTLGLGLRSLGTSAAFHKRWQQPRTQRHRVLHASGLRTPADRHSALMYGQWPLVRETLSEGDTAYSAFHSRWTECALDPWALDQPANRAYDLREWLPNVFLEKSDRASMLHGLEIRTPYLDPLVAHAASSYSPRNTQKQILRDDLYRLLPGVLLPNRKKGLSVDVHALVNGHYSDLIRRTVCDRESILKELGLKSDDRFAEALRSSPTFGFRIAMLGLWQETWQ